MARVAKIGRRSPGCSRVRQPCSTPAAATASTWAALDTLGAWITVNPRARVGKRARVSFPPLRPQGPCPQALPLACVGLLPVLARVGKGGDRLLVLVLSTRRSSQDKDALVCFCPALPGIKRVQAMLLGCSCSARLITTVSVVLCHRDIQSPAVKSEAALAHLACSSSSARHDGGVLPGCRWRLRPLLL